MVVEVFGLVRWLSNKYRFAAWLNPVWGVYCVTPVRISKLYRIKIRTFVICVECRWLLSFAQNWGIFLFHNLSNGSNKTDEKLNELKVCNRLSDWFSVSFEFMLSWKCRFNNYDVRTFICISMMTWIKLCEAFGDALKMTLTLIVPNTGHLIQMTYFHQNLSITV